MTRLEVLDQVRKFLSDEKAPYLWSDDELNFYYDLAVKEFCKHTRIFLKTVEYSTEAGKFLYDFPSSLIDIDFVSVEGKDLDKIPYEFISSHKGILGEVRWFCLDYRPDKVLLHYAPKSDGMKVEITGPAIPEGAEIDSAVPVKYSHYLVDGVIATAFTKTDTETISPLAEKYLALWVADIEKVKRDLERQYQHYINRTIIPKGLL